jgi:hypothetical protein
MHSPLTYEVQKAITQERLHSVAVAQRTQLERDARWPRRPAGARLHSNPGFRAVLGLLGLPYGPARSTST